MKITEARKIVESSELSEAALKRSLELLQSFGDDDFELEDSQLDQLIAILDADIDADKLLLKANEDVQMVLGGFLGEIKENMKIAGDQVESTVKEMYSETESLLNKVKSDK